jgi:2-keto-4-pentenoate hydratase/2-oxohepta-3-ene-1,7-dioic acid hydratase in catechol pathway
MVQLPIAGTSERLGLTPTKIIALGLNYRAHVAESPSVLARAAKPGAAPVPAGSAEPTEPILFAKTPNVLIGDGDEIVLPEILASYALSAPRTDYEAELAFVVGRRCRNVREEEALSHILGFTCFNDVSQRDIQNSDRSGWFRGKSFDTFGPIGPVLVPAAALGDPDRLRIRCRLNGATVQDANTSDMIFSIAFTLAFISRNLTLEPGDIVTTGTPAGVGPLKAGDLVEVEIEKIGVLSNRVRG